MLHHLKLTARITSTFISPESGNPLAITPELLSGAILRDFPEIASAVRLRPADVIVRHDKDLFKENDLCYSEQSIFSVFTFTFLEGSPEKALTMPGSIVLTRSFEKKYFGKGPSLRRVLICDGKPFQVSAVIEDRPANSDLPIRALLYKDFSTITSWLGDDFAYTFVLFRGAPDLKRFTSHLAQLEKYTSAAMEEDGAKGYRMSFQTEMLKDVHFSTGNLGDTDNKGNRQFNTIFSVLAVFILLIALLNYINLSTTSAITFL